MEDFKCVHFGFGRKLCQKPHPNPVLAGIHKKECIFIAYGADIKRAREIEDAKTYDIAPTILYMFSLPVPDNMSSRVLKEVFRERSELALSR